MKTVLYVILCFSSLLLSCERAVLDKKSSISIYLPGDSSVLQSVTDPLNSVSLYSSNSGTGGEDFNSFIMPVFGSSSTYPVNCYIVAVAAQNSESFFSKNYCGKRSTVTGRIDPNFKFGPYMALVKAGTSFEIEVPAGDKRLVYVFAMHAQNPEACKILTSGEGENPSKENFSKPYFVGSSALFSVLPGQSTSVPINLIQPVAAASIDDCVFSSIGNKESNVANAVAIERNSFPENIMNTAFQITDTNPSSYRCDFVDIVPKYQYINNANTDFKSARLDAQKNFTVVHDASGGTGPTFRSKYDCENNINSSNTFSIFPSDEKVRRWFKLDYTLGTGIIANFRAASTDGSLVSPYKPIKLISGRVTYPGAELVAGINAYRGGYDISIPKKIFAGQCYQMFITRKTLEGFPITDATITTMFSINQSPVGSVQLFNDSGCTSAVGATSILATTFYTGYFFKATQNFELSVSNISGFTTAVETSTPVKVAVVASTTNVQPEFVEISANDVFTRGASLGCQPITFRLKNKDGVVVAMPANGSIEILFGQSDTFDANQFSSSFMCTSNYLNPGAAQITVPPGAQFAKIYINNNTPSTEGLKTIRFKVFDGTKYYYLKHTFEVVSPNN